MSNIFQEILKPLLLSNNTVEELLDKINFNLIRPLEENRQRVFLGLSDGTRSIKVNSISLTISTDNVSNPPTNAECITAFGSVADTGEGFIGLIDDAGGHANEYMIINDGTKYWQITLTACA